MGSLETVATFAPQSEEPIRSELFSVERLEQHAESLAATQHTASRRTKERNLAKRLNDNDRVLQAAYHWLIKATRNERPITAAADWLVDNFHAVEE